MKKTIFRTAAAAFVFLIHPFVNAADNVGPGSLLTTAEIYQLMKDKGYHCLECHDVENRVVGPSWREIAANRNGYQWAHALIVYKISSGSVGEYGTVPMPHNEVLDEDLDAIAGWITSQLP
jgi:cytochrome c